VLPVANHVVLRLPYEGEAADRVLTEPVLRSVVESMVTSWQPSWAFVQSDGYRSRIQIPQGKPYVGWMLYLAKERGVVPSLPPSVQVLPAQDGGSLIILTSERFTAHNEGHLALAKEVWDILDRSGVLAPLSSFE